MANKKEFWIEKLGKKWTMQLKNMLRSPYSTKLMNFITIEYAMNDIEPYKVDMFNAYKLCKWEDLKIVIIGDKPYTTTTSNGLAYSNKFLSQFYSAEISIIHDCLEKEYYKDGFYLDFDFSLENWAKQGVFLINKQLTTRIKDDENIHKKPWSKFISATLNAIVEYKPGTIFILWGKEAQLLEPHLKNMYILKYDHPSKYVDSNKDWNCPNFKEADKILIDLYGETVKW